MATDWLRMLGDVTEDDLKTLDARIAEGKREQEALASLRKVFAARLGLAPAPPKPPSAPAAAPPPPPRVPSAPKASAPGGGTFADYRVKVASYILHAGLPVKSSTLAAGCGVPGGSITAVLDHAWFRRAADGTGYELTAEGRRSAGAA